MVGSVSFSVREGQHSAYAPLPGRTQNGERHVDFRSRKLHSPTMLRRASERPQERFERSLAEGAGVVIF